MHMRAGKSIFPGLKAHRRYKPESRMIDVEEKLGLVGENIAEGNGGWRVARFDIVGTLSEGISSSAEDNFRVHAN